MEAKRCPKCGLPSYGDKYCSACMTPLTPGQMIEPKNKPKPVVTASSKFISNMAGVLVLGLGAYWLWIFARELTNALDSRPDVVGGARVYAVSLLSLVLALYTIFVAFLIFRRSFRARGELILVSVVGIVLGVVVPVLLGSWYQIAVVGAHGVLVLFALFGSHFFDFGR